MLFTACEAGNITAQDVLEDSCLSLRGRRLGGEKGCGSVHGHPDLCSETTELVNKGEVSVALKDPSAPGCELSGILWL